MLDIIYRGKGYTFYKGGGCLLFAALQSPGGRLPARNAGEPAFALKMSEAFALDGCFIFLSEAIGGIEPEADGVCREIDTWLMKRRIAPGFLWIQNNGSAAGNWRRWFLDCPPDGEVRRFVQKGSIGYHRYRLGIRKDAAAAIDEDKEAIIFSHEKGAAYFCVPGGKYVPDGTLSLSLSDVSCGEISGKFLIARGQWKNFFTDMQIGLCYQLQQVPDEWERSIGTVKFFPQPAEDMENAFIMHLAPNDIFALGKTWFSLEKEAEAGGLAQDIYGNGISAWIGPDVRFVFQPEVLGTALAGNQEGDKDYIQAAYLTLDGMVRFAAQNKKILCGLNANEFIDGSEAEQLYGRFRAGEAAFYIPAEGDGEEGGLSDAAQTAYLTLENGTPYYSQAAEARLFAKSAKARCLKVFDYPQGYFDSQIKIPYFPYTSSVTASMRPVRQELDGALSRKRLSIMQQVQGQRDGRNVQKLQASDGRAVTVHGLLSGWGDADVPLWIGLADQGRSAGDDPDLRLTGIKKEFFGQFLKKDVLIMYADPKELMEQVSTPYYVDDTAYAVIQKAFPAPDPGSLKGVFFETEAEYLDEVEKLDASYRTDEEKRKVFLRAAADFSLEVEGWNFQLSPRAFRDYGEGTDTLFFLKYTKEVSLNEWMQGSTNTNYAAMLKKIQESPENYEELQEILESREWCGILFLNVPVSIERISPELSFLMDGIDRTQFYASYAAVGESQVKIEEGRLRMCSPVISALIYYEEPYSNKFREGAPDIWLRTAKLKVKISGSRIMEFESVSELTMNKLFESALTKENTGSGNAMVMNGTCQRIGESVRYIFKLREEGIYSTALGGISSFRIEEVCFLCGEQPKIELSGNMNFLEEEECDLLSYGNETAGLPFSLMLREKAGQKCWEPDYTTLTIVSAEPGLRKNAFLARFPADLIGFNYESDKNPLEMGYTSVSSPIKQGEITAPCFCMNFRLNLGGLGALTDNLKLTLDLCAAWCISEGEDKWFVGIRLDGTHGFTLQSILNVGFKNVSIRTKKEEENLNYYLEFRNFRVSLAGYQFPPGSNAITIFSDPENPREAAWHAAYLDE